MLCFSVFFVFLFLGALSFVPAHNHSFAESPSFLKLVAMPDASLSLSPFVGLFISHFFGLCSGCVLCWGLVRTQSSLWCFYFSFSVQTVFSSVLGSGTPVWLSSSPLPSTSLSSPRLGSYRLPSRVTADQSITAPHPLVLTTCSTVISHFWGFVAPQ